MTGERETPLALEIAVAWLLVFVVAIEMLVTYSRLPAHELYKFSGSGLVEGGLSRVLVWSNYPVALVAIAVLLLLFEGLPTRAEQAVAVVGVALAAVLFWPGVVDQGNLDAKTINALAAIGVLIAIVFTALRARNGVARSGRQPGDGVRIVASIAALLVALPWLAADLGFYLDRVPVLGDVFETSKLPAYVWTASEASLPYVHHGHHHGMDGVLLGLFAALLSRAVPGLRNHRLRVAAGLYLSVMASYAIALIANDAWGEQIVKRDWTRRTIPNIVRPSVTIARGLIMLGAAAIYGVSACWSRRAAAEEQVAVTPVAHV